MIERVAKYLFLLFLFINIQTSLSQVNVTVKDTTIPLGEIYTIPILISIPQGTYMDIESVSLKFTYNAYVINIQNVSGAESYLMNCEAPSFSNDYDDLEETMLSISCNICSLIEDDTLCTIDIQGLAGKDSVTSFSPVEISINGSIVEDAEKISGEIVVPGPNIIQQYPEGLGQNFPNPAHQRTVFPFNINKTSKAEFEIYNSDGKHILSSKTDKNIFSMFYESKDGVVFIDDLNTELSQGSYFLNLHFTEFEISSGLYYLVMKTKNGRYNRSFLLIR